MKRLACIVFSIAAAAAYSQGTANLDEYYRFPLGVGVEYRSMIPIGWSFPNTFSNMDIAGIVTVPIPSIPRVQPFIRVGYAGYDSLDAAAPVKMDFSMVHGSLGLAYSSRFAKNFEVGIEASVGAAEAVFPNIIETGTVGSPYIVCDLGGKVSLIPSYSLSVDLRPGIGYRKAMGPLTSFDGFTLSLGFSVGFRFGDDPDSAKSVIRSLRFENLEFPDAFGAMQGYYSKNPIGYISLKNTERRELSDVEVSFMQPGYMDTPTPSIRLTRIKGMETVKVPLSAVFNGKVFETEGKIPLSGEIIIAYRASGRPAEQRHSVTYNLFDKSAVVWDDDRKEAAFITPQDGALRNYAAWINEAVKDRDLDLPGYNEPIQAAMRVYGALRVLGMSYQADPASPFAKVQGKKEAVDSVTLPRATLKRKFGDCDDLTALYCSLLESCNVETGFITVPGHIFPAINTKLPSSSIGEIAVDKASVILVGDDVWIPLEITMLDDDSTFLEAWAQGAALWKASQSSRAFYKTREAQELYGPVSLREADLALQYGSGERVAALFKKDRDRLIDRLVDASSSVAEKTKSKVDFNRLGVLQAKFGRMSGAEESFARAIRIDPKYASALSNLGNVSFLRSEYGKAIESYRSALAVVGTRGSSAASASLSMIGNIVKSYAAMGKSDLAKPYVEKAMKLDPVRGRQLFAGMVDESGTVRAGDIAAGTKSIEYLYEEF